MTTRKASPKKDSREYIEANRSRDDNPHVRIPQRESYPSDLTTRQWREIDIVIPSDRIRGRKRDTSIRELINAMNYRWMTGCSWRMLPHDLPPWPTVYTYFRRWLKDGTLKQIRDILLEATNKKPNDDDDLPESV